MIPVVISISFPHSSRPHNEALYVNTIVDREKHTRSVLNAHPQPLLIQKAEVLND